MTSRYGYIKLKQNSVSIMSTLLKQSRSQKTRLALLGGAIDLLNSGLSEFSMPAVAKQAGKSVGALYEHFGSRDDLLDAVYADYVSRRTQFIKDAFEAGGATTAHNMHTRIAYFIDQFTEWYADNQGVLRSFLQHTWLKSDVTGQHETSEFDTNVLIVAHYICGSRWEKLSNVQQSAAERIIAYAIILLREALVIRLVPNALAETSQHKTIAKDIRMIISNYLDHLII